MTKQAQNGQHAPASPQAPPQSHARSVAVQPSGKTMHDPATTPTAAANAPSAPAASTAASPAERSDEQLLLAHRRDPKAGHLATLIKRYERELYSYLCRFLGDATQAQDAFQATFLQVHLKSGMFDAKRKFRPWLYTVATNQAIDSQRRNRRHQLVSLDRPNKSEHTEVGTLLDLLGSREANPAERFERGERIEWVRQAVAALPEQLRNVVSLVYFRGLKYREAAVELAVPVGTVKSRLHSAIGELGREWRNSERG
ncbi:MAG: sigma-70 family RNA polymerase sigma factor [Planctomycetota bacterium]